MGCKVILTEVYFPVIITPRLAHHLTFDFIEPGLVNGNTCIFIFVFHTSFLHLLTCYVYDKITALRL